MAKLLEITGKAISGEWGQDDDSGTGIPVLRTTNFTNEGFVNYKNVVTRSIAKKKIAEKYLRHGDIIIEKSGGSDKQPVGRVIFFEGEEKKYLFNNFTGLLRVQNPEEWLPKYVFYALYAYYRNGGTRAFENRTTGLHNLQVDNYVKSADIPKLSYRKQQHICETLDHVRDAVAYREQQLSKLDELIKARFVEMFGDPVNNPMRWKRLRFDDICENLDARRIPITEGDRKKGAYPYYGASGIVDWVDGYIFDENLLLVSEDGANLLMRSTPIAFSVSGRVWVNNHAHVVRFQDFATQKYIETYFSLIDISEYITGTAQPKLNQAKLNSMKFNFPSLSLQNQFADFVEEVDKSKVEVQKALDQTQLLFDSLMQQYFG